jgi:hypothetical protein
VAAPTLSSVDVSVGDAAGSVTIVLAGTNLTGTTGVTLGGTACTGVVVDSDVQVTCVTPAKTASETALDIVLTTPGGSATLSSAYTAWAPSLLSPTVWLRADYAASPWADESGNGRDATEATNPPAVGTALNGWDPADFDGAADQMTLPGTLDTYINAAAWSFVFLYYADTVPADPGAGSRFLTENLASCAGSYFVIAMTDSGVSIEAADGVSAGSYVTQACSTGAYHAIFCKYDGTTLYVGIDQVAYSIETYANIADLSYTLRIGTEYTGAAAFIDGRMAEVIAMDTEISDAARTKVLAYINTRYGLSL